MTDTCKGCGKEIFWVKAGRAKVPLDPKSPVYQDIGHGRAVRVNHCYVSHFATCPKAGKFSSTGKEEREKLEAEVGRLKSRIEETAAAIPKWCEGPGNVGAVLHLVETGEKLEAEVERLKAKLERRENTLSEIAAAAPPKDAVWMISTAGNALLEGLG